MSLAVDQYHRAAGSGDVRSPFGLAVTTTYDDHDARLRFLDHLQGLWRDQLGYLSRWAGPGLIFCHDAAGLVVKVAVARNTKTHTLLGADEVGRLAAANHPEVEVQRLRLDHRKDPTR